MHSLAALENLTTCNTKEDGLFRLPSTFQNARQCCHIEASPCQAVEERDSWREMVVLTDRWLETAECGEKRWSREGEGQRDRVCSWTHGSPSRDSHRRLGRRGFAEVLMIRCGHHSEERMSHGRNVCIVTVILSFLLHFPLTFCFFFFM